MAYSNYLSIDGIHVYVCFLGPLLPEFRVIQGNIIAVLRGNKTGFRECGSLALTLNGDSSGSSLKDLVDVLLTEPTALIILIHDGSISSLPQQILDLLLRELLDLLKVTRKTVYITKTLQLFQLTHQTVAVRFNDLILTPLTSLLSLFPLMLCKTARSKPSFKLALSSISLS